MKVSSRSTKTEIKAVFVALKEEEMSFKHEMYAQIQMQSDHVFNLADRGECYTAGLTKPVCLKLIKKLFHFTD